MWHKNFDTDATAHSHVIYQLTNENLLKHLNKSIVLYILLFMIIILSVVIRNSTTSYGEEKKVKINFME